MNLLQRWTGGRGIERSWGLGEQFNLAGLNYWLSGYSTQTLGGKVEQVDPGFTGLVQRAYAANGIVFACMLARMMLFTEARFQYQQMRSGRPGDYFGDRERPNSNLAVLDHPWPGGTTGDLLKFMIADADLAGNAFVARPKMGPRLVRLRPDWVKIVHGTPDPDGTMWDPDAELLGYTYQAGGPTAGKDPVFFDASEVAHFSLVPNPLTTLAGFSWLTPVIPQLMSHQAASEHKLRYWEHGASPNMSVAVKISDPKKFNEWVQIFRQNHEGVGNAAKTLFISDGTTVTPLGNSLQQADVKAVQGADETVICAAAGVPPVVVGISEGLQGSSLNSGNFAAAMRRFADMFARPAWRNVAGSLERIIPPPSGTRLWYDDRDIPALKDDIKDAAEVGAQNATAMRTLRDGGWEPDSVVKAVTSGDYTQLVGHHDGTKPVQQQPDSGTAKPDMPMKPGDMTPPTNGQKPATPTGGAV